MFTHHPTRADLEVFLHDPTRVVPKTNAVVVRHLLAGCGTCREHLDSLGWERSRLERLLQLRPGSLESPEARLFDYSGAFTGAERALDAFFAQGRAQEASAEELQAELSPLSAEEQIRRVGTDRRFANPELVKQLIEGSQAVRFHDPEKLLHLAHLACLAAESCSEEECGSPEKLADLRCQSWRQYGTALRVQSRLRESDAAFARAQRFCEEGTGDPPVRAQLFSTLLSLRMAQRRFNEAIQLADDAGRIYQEIGDTNALASTLVQKAIAYIYSGEPGDAVPVLNRAIPLIKQDDTHLLLAACHNLVRCYLDLERPEQALSLFFEVRELYREVDDALILLRAGTQEGYMLRDLGHLRAAEAAFIRSRDGFCEHKLIYEAAIVSLDLAAIYVKLGDAEKLQETVATTVPIFRSLGVDREAMAGLLQLGQLATQGQRAFDLIRRLGNKVEQLNRKAS
ncbi:MAG TPA: tetratricopeptide repeat protein [Thermoanaerobaculia bacterium]|nr:tetratricopeptide repeat protein [Thermoanaerobaculia bacterium]